MSWVFLVCIAFLLAAVVLIELRAVREGDERTHHGPGYRFILTGLVLIGFGLAAAATAQNFFALTLSFAGLVSVVIGATRHRDYFVSGRTRHLH